MQHVHTANSIAPPSADGSRKYSVIFSSANKDSGTNNSATFQTRMSQILPPKWGEFHVTYAFLGPASSAYTNKGWQLGLNFGTRSFTLDSYTESQSTLAGFVLGNSGSFCAAICDNPGICISRPDSGITVQLRTIDGALATTTAGGDIGDWILILQFTPVTSSIILNQRYQDI